MAVQNVLNYFQTPEAQIKVAIGTCVGSAVSAYFGPLSWLGFTIVHLGSQAFVHGADPLINRCRQLFNPPAARPLDGRVVRHEDRDALGVENISEEEAIRSAIAASLETVPDDYKLFEEAKQRSVHGYDERQPHSSYRCALDELGGSENAIDAEFTVQLGQNSFHLFNLVFALLSQTNMQNPFTREPISEESAIEVAGKLGINPDEFMNIWALSATPGLAPTHHVPETEAGLKTDFRFQLLERMLQSKDGTLYQIRMRERILTLLSQEPAWIAQMHKPKML